MNVIIDTPPHSLAAKKDEASTFSRIGSTPTGPDRPSSRPLAIRYSPSTKFNPRITVTSRESLSKKQRRKRVVLPCAELPHPSVRQKRLADMLDHARQEAEALAATTPFPSLLLPCLLEEKLDQARIYATRQQQVWQASRDILCLSV